MSSFAGLARSIASATVAWPTLVAATFAADPRVSLEVVTTPNVVPTEAGKWSELLSQAGFVNVRIRSAGGDEQPQIEKRGAESSPTYHVVGILTSDNKLVVPHGQFGLSDRSKIEQWLTKLREGGLEGFSVKPAAFGLLPRQLVAVHEALAVPISFSTRGKQPREVAQQIASGLPMKFVSDGAVQTALAADEPVADELQGLSSGTGLAALLRPLGLALVPEKSAGDVRLRIVDRKTAKEIWPVGWPPKQNPGQTLPELFKYLNVEIAQTPASEALTAIADRLKTPVLIDHNNVARYQADLNTKIDLPKAKTFYGDALNKLLYQARLKYELRLDEANKPFLWVTTQRQ